MRYPPLILAVDDTPENLDILRMRLEAHDYAVVTAADGREAIDALERERPQLVLMDVMMPTLDGRAAYRAMRARPDLPAVPVVLMSAAVGPERLDPTISAFLPKPFDLDDLLALVARLIGAPEPSTPRA